MTSTYLCDMNTAHSFFQEIVRHANLSSRAHEATALNFRLGYSEEYDYKVQTKASLIDDLFKVMKASIPINGKFCDLDENDKVIYFDALHEMTITEKEIMLNQLTKELEDYHNNKGFQPRYQIRRDDDGC